VTPPDDEAVPLAPAHLDDAFGRSLRRSRARRAVAARLRDRRRRTRGGGSAVAVTLAAGALLAPFALAQDTGSGSAALLQPGSRGDAVTAVQQALGVPQTGRYDAVTRRAVRAFQRRNGLTVDGIVGPQTRRALLGKPSAATPDGGTTAGGATAAPAASEALSGSVDPADLDALKRIAACESGGDPTAVSSDGRYRGKYQFDRATWADAGGSGDPAAASEAEQDLRALDLLQREGTEPWPVCGPGA